MGTIAAASFSTMSAGVPLGTEMPNQPAASNPGTVSATVTTSGSVLARFAVVDSNGHMVGFGEGGLERDDVPAGRHDVSSTMTGWWVVAPADGASYNVFGLRGDDATACYVGMIPA